MVSSKPVLKIAIPSPLRRVFDYLPTRQVDLSSVQPGGRYRVPFGPREVVGVLLGCAQSTDIEHKKLKYVKACLDHEPVLSPTLLRMCEFGSRYYKHSIGEVISQALPALLRQGEPAALKQSKEWVLTKKGRLVSPESLGRALKQKEALAKLQEHERGLSREIIKTLGIASAHLKGLEARGLVEERARETDSEAFAWREQSPLAVGQLELNEEQQTALEALTESLGGFSAFLLEGVTGSGKTEVYLQLIEQVLKKGQQVLVLVPEIGLTPQTVSRFRNRFKAPVIALHSGLSDRERLDGWLHARSGHAAIVIGTRSAIFTPLSQPGLIIIDEEHDQSFKQQDTFRYSARDLGVFRAKIENIPILLGSATPALETLYNACSGRYQHLSLTRRAGGAEPPRFRLVDIRRAELNQGVSTVLVETINEHLAKGNQVLVFLNRRGFAPALMCHECGWLAECDRCDVRYTLHKTPLHLHCHHCDRERKVDRFCPKCGGADLRAIGAGTARIEEDLAALFSEHKVVRIDRDTTRRKGAIERLISEVGRGEPCILVGTQMLAKGHHFPNVTLVAILDADHGFFSADFRACERMSQLIVQVAGRAGRESKKGEVILQTRQPDHPLLSTLITEGYPAFAATALEERSVVGLPPFGFMALIRAEAAKGENATLFLEEAKAICNGQEASQFVQVLGPVPAPMQKRAGRYRAQLLLTSTRRMALHRVLDGAVNDIEALRSAGRVRWSLDVDPQEID